MIFSLVCCFFNIFKNSSTRTADGGANVTTLRNDGGPLRLQSNTGMGIWVGSTGNVGINTTVPGSPLDVKGNSSWGLTRLAPTTSGGETAIGFFALNDFTATGQATSGNWLLGTGINSGGASNFNLLRNTTNMLTVATNGNVGIGTTSPSAKLNVNGDNTGSNGSLLITGKDSFNNSLYVASDSPSKRLGFNHNGTIGNIFAFDYTTLSSQNLILQWAGGNVGI
ncbi:MAG: hypothetical protein RL498_155, partial [Pseudomonadota bacterium]